ncbi:MAG: rhodanese-like domain-containing protein [Acidobacteria bacterium]|nr:rhodanese-like domain-containing protein [Acidobacteriota bacterium]
MPSCAEGGVLGVLPGIIGAIQAHEAIKLLLDLGEPLIGRLLVFDGLAMRFREIVLPKDPRCPVCSENPTQRELVGHDESCRVEEPATERELAGVDIAFGISPVEVQTWREQGRAFRILDVRTPIEYQIARVEDSSLLPLDELPRRFEELDRQEDLVVMCHHGVRSAQAVTFLRQQGFTRARNLDGGIAAWSRDVDDSVPRY